MLLGCSLRRNGASSSRGFQAWCCSSDPSGRLELPAHAGLHLPWITESAANRAVEVEQQAAIRRIPEVVVARQIEDFDNGVDSSARAHVERPREAGVQREVRIVLPQRVPLENVSIGAIAVRR